MDFQEDLAHKVILVSLVLMGIWVAPDLLEGPDCLDRMECLVKLAFLVFKAVMGKEVPLEVKENQVLVA